uniref:Putative P4-family integrase n=1 Tax=Haliea sp. ETY-M TaxID=1055105 RepID=A0A455R334_9GAMM|nr:putative P4-family integrase [Haliea sp. ETY-M]
MPKIAKQLTALQVERLRHKPNGKPAYHAVGGVPGLLLQCRPPAPGKDIGARSWVLRTVVGSKRRDIGLGGFPGVTLSMARDRAREAKQLIFEGIDPVDHRRALRSALAREQEKTRTFKQVAEKFAKKKGAEFKTTKQLQKLEGHLRDYIYPRLGHMIVSDIERAHVIAVLEPIWETKTETATRVRGTIESVLDLAHVEGLRTGENPARWKGNLELGLVKPDKATKRVSRPSLAYAELPAFWRQLSQSDAMGARALQFQILTAARPGEARTARWEHIDFTAKIWTIPADDMKGGKEHRVPLSECAIKVLKSTPRLSDYVFASRNGGPISNVMPTKSLQALHDKKLAADGIGYVDHKQDGRRITAHGFRSTFRTWSQEHTKYREEVLELALAHVNSDATRAAYARSELIEQRAKLMRDWERFVLNGPRQGKKVVGIREARA